MLTIISGAFSTILALAWSFAGQLPGGSEPQASDTPTAFAAHHARIALQGDANCDELVGLEDALLVRRIVAGLEDEGEGCSADVDGSGTTEAPDALLVLRILAGLPVGKSDQSITFPPISPRTYTPGGTFLLAATASSGLPVSFSSSSPAVCDINATTVSILAAGDCGITATQPGNDDFNAAPNVSRTIVIGKANQTIDFPAPNSQAFVFQGTFALVATSSSGLPVSFASTTPSVCTVTASTATMLSAGSCSITASQGGNGNFNAAPDVVQAVSIGKTDQTITFMEIAPQTFSPYGAFALNATASSGLPVSFASTTPTICTVTGTTATVLGAGSCSITASQPGDDVHAPAPNSTQLVTIGKANQTVAFSTAGSRLFTLGGTFGVTATASSGLPVSLASTTTAICTVAGGVGTMVAAGSCSIIASQSGNTNYNAAPNISEIIALDPNVAPILQPVGNRTIALGSDLFIQLAATDADGDPIRYHASPLPLPDNASLDAATGLFQFRPSALQVGTYSLTFTAADDQGLQDSESIIVTVSGPGSTTRLMGRVLDTNSYVEDSVVPVVGARISLIGSSSVATTDSDGFFLLTGVPSGPQVFDINGTLANLAPDGSPYAKFREKIEIIGGVTNNISRPFFLPRIETPTLVAIDPSVATVVENARLGISIVIPPHTAKAEDGSDFTGQMSISEVPGGLAPAPMPPELAPNRVVTIQPVGVVFAQPVPITFGGMSGLNPDAEVSIWSIDPAQGVFVTVGTGRVSASGGAIETSAGGIRAADWHYWTPTPPDLMPDGDAPGDNQEASCEKEANTASSVILGTGCTKTTIDLPTMVVRGDAVSQQLVYRSDRASGLYAVPFNHTVGCLGGNLVGIAYRASLGGVVSDFSQATVSGRSYALLDASGLTPGIYKYRIYVTYTYQVRSDGVGTNNSVCLPGGGVIVGVSLGSSGGGGGGGGNQSIFTVAAVTSILMGELLVQPDPDGSFGRGWNLSGLERLYPMASGDVLYTGGDGSMLRYREERAGLVTFSTGIDGWDITGDTDGIVWNSAGFVCATDQNYGGTWYFKAPTTFRRDWRAAYGQNLEFKIKVSSDTVGGAQPASIIIQGQFGTLQARIPFQLPSNTWQQISLPLDSSSIWVDLFTGTAATQAQVIQALRNVEDFRIRGEYHAGVDTGCLDDVRVTGLTLPTGTFQSPPGDFTSLRILGNGTYERFDPIPGVTRAFNSAGRLTSVRDVLSTLATFSYNPDGTLLSTTDAAARATTFGYSSGRLRTITDPAGRTTTFATDARGDLTQVDYPGYGGMKFTYDSRHLLLDEIDSLGQTTTHEYDAFGRLRKAIFPDGTTRSVLSTTASGNRRSIIDELGRVITVETNRYGSVTSQTSPSGAVTTTTRNTAGLPVAITFPSGQTITNTFDLNTGNLLSSRDSVTGGRSTFEYSGPRDLLTSATDPLDATTTFTRDANGLVTEVTSPEGRTTHLVYDVKGLLTSTTDVDGLTTTLVRDSIGNVTTITVGTGPTARVTLVEYTGAGYVSAVTNALGQRIEYQYDPHGNVTEQTFADGSAVAFGYDTEGRIVSVTLPSGAVHEYEYAARGTLTSSTKPPIAGQPFETTTTYAKDTRPLETHDPDGTTTIFAYDQYGRPAGVTDRRGLSTTVVYEPGLDRIISMTTSAGNDLAFTYVGSLLTGLTQAGAAPGSYSIDIDDAYRVTQDSLNGAALGTYAYDDDGLLKQAGGLSLAHDPASGRLTSTTQGVVTTAMTYNAFGETATVTTSVNGTPLLEFTYIYDSLGRITGITETGGNPLTRTFGYDQRGQLTSVTPSTGAPTAYAYDANGNRLTKSEGGGTANYTYDAQDRLTTSPGTTWSYDSAGRLTEARRSTGQVTTYSYDGAGNLRQVTLVDGTVIAYDIDGLNNRVGRRVNGVLERGWIHNMSGRPVAELDGAGNVVSRFIYGTNSYVPDYMQRGANTYRIITDHLGSPRYVVDVATGAVAQQLDYDEFGVVLSDTNPGFQPFGFAGGMYDSATGLVRFGVRDYLPGVGRWTAADPIGFAGGQANLYSYVASDPISYVDDSGLGLGDWLERQAAKISVRSFAPVVNITAGIGDTIGGNLSKTIRNNFGINEVDYCSPEYELGQGIGKTYNYATSVFSAASAIKSALAFKQLYNAYNYLKLSQFDNPALLSAIRGEMGKRVLEAMLAPAWSFLVSPRLDAVLGEGSGDFIGGLLP